MNFTELNNAAERHPWRSSLFAGLFAGLLTAVLFGGVTLSVVAGLSHTVIQLLGFAFRRRRLAKAATAGLDGRPSPPAS